MKKGGIASYFKPLSEKNNFATGIQNGSKPRPNFNEKPIAVSSDEEPVKNEDIVEIPANGHVSEGDADVELDEPVFHKLASPKKLRKRSSSIRSNQNEEDRETDQSEEEEEDEVPLRRKSTRVRRSVIPDAPEPSPEKEANRPKSRQRSKQTSPRVAPDKPAKPIRKRKKKLKKATERADPHRDRSGYIFSTDSHEASETTEYESDFEPEEKTIPKANKRTKKDPLAQIIIQSTQSQPNLHNLTPTKKNKQPKKASESENNESEIYESENYESDFFEIQMSDSDNIEINEDNLEQILRERQTEPTEAEMLLDVKFYTKDRSISEDLPDEKETENFLSELEKLTDGRLDIRAKWDCITRRSQTVALQLTRLYKPDSSRDFFMDAMKSSEEMEQIIDWFKGWRDLVNRRKQVEDKEEPSSQQSYDSMGSDSWHGQDSQEDEQSKTLFLYGTSGVGKSSLVYACAAQYHFQVIEVHAGMTRSGPEITSRLKEATQTERVQPKNSIKNFFMKKSDKKTESDKDSSGEKSDSLILFSGVDLLFENHDEGFWAALKKISETSKIPIVFTADNLEANTGLNPDKQNQTVLDDENFKHKCKEVYIHRPSSGDAIAMIRMIALNQGFPLNQEDAGNLVRYSSSYRSCLLNLQLWLNSYPVRLSRPLEILTSFTTQISQLSSRESDPAQVESFYHANIPFVALNRWKLTQNSNFTAKSIEKNSLTKPDVISKLANYLSCFTIFDKEKMIDQEVRITAKSDCRRGRTDKPSVYTKDFSSFKSIQSFTETLSLQHFTDQLKNGPQFGVMDSENHLTFDNYYQKTRSLSISSPNETLLESELEMDGLISAHTQHGNWYQLGRKFHCDYSPAIRELIRAAPEMPSIKTGSSRRSRANQAPYYSHILDLQADEIEKLKSAFEVS